MNRRNKTQWLIILCIATFITACSSASHQGTTKADSYTLQEAQKPLINYFLMTNKCPKESLKLETSIKGPFLDFDTHDEIGTEELWVLSGCGKKETMRVIIEQRTWYGLQDYSTYLTINPYSMGK